MAKRLKNLIFLLIFLASQISFGQNEIVKTQVMNADIFTEFNSFFDKEIKHQGIKGDWIFKLNEITGNHKFDFNNDGFNDVLIEFNAIPVEGGGVNYFYAVLFENQQNTSYKFVNYLDCQNLEFKYYHDDKFIFLGKNSGQHDENFILSNSKFINSN